MSASKAKASATKLQIIELTWPLARWGIDIIGKLPTAHGNLQYAVVAMEYFTKWIEAKPVTNMSSFTMKKFLWQNIICRFGVPRHITVDNGTQFDSQNFREYYKSLGIQLCFASVKAPTIKRCSRTSKWNYMHRNIKMPHGAAKRQMDG
jgi:hypothetical protein